MTRQATRHSTALRGSFAGACLTMVAVLGCHQELPPPLSMGETHTVGVDEPAVADDDGDTRDPQADTRDLWFSEGLGREAILARERRDHASAASLLDQLLADPQLTSSDRAGAELLRALEDLRVDHFAEAAERLARARAAPALAPVEPYLRMLEAQARLDARESDAALKLIADLTADPKAGVPIRVLLVKADAQARTNDRAGAITTYEAFLQRADSGDRHEARRKLAVLLLDGDDDDKRAAAKLFEQLITEVPLSDYGVEAEAELRKLEKAKLITRSKAERQRLARDRAKAEAERYLDQRSYGSAVQSVDKFIKRAKQHGADDGDRCEVLFIKGSAIFKLRKRAASQPVFDSAAKHCARASDVTREVKSRYQAARGLYANGKHEQAAARFEQLARDHAGHSYADDSLIKAGESWESAGEPAKARAAYESSLAKHPNGDMYGEALRRLLVQGFAEGRLTDAVDLIDRSIAGGKVDGDELAKLHYFRGKALDRLGQGEQAEAAWLQAIETRPLSYPSLQALSRLRERSDEAAAAGLAKISASSDAPLPELALPATPTAARVKLWASLGLGEQAREELGAAAITGWPAVAVLAQAGLYSDAQRALASVGSGWRQAGPSGARRQLWELAYPVPFRSLVDPGEHDHGVPALLTYAIMQSESRFNPGATSWAGARGLIQLMPATAQNVAQRAGLKVEASQLYDPATNLDIGQRYLAGLTARWNNVDGAPALAVPSYNAGPGRTDEWLKLRGSWDLDLFVEAIPFDETRRYTQSVLGRWAAYRWLYGVGDDAARMPYMPLKTPK